MKKFLFIIIILFLLILSGCVDKGEIEKNLKGKDYKVTEMTYTSLGFRINVDNMDLTINEDFTLTYENHHLENVLIRLSKKSLKKFYSKLNLGNGWIGSISSTKELLKNNAYSWKTTEPHQYELYPGHWVETTIIYLILRQKNGDMHLAIGNQNNEDKEFTYFIMYKFEEIQLSNV